MMLWNRVALAALAFTAVLGVVAGLLAASRRRQRSQMRKVGDKELRRLIAKAPKGHFCRNPECTWEQPTRWWVAGPPLSLRRVVRTVLRRHARSGGDR